ncbi:MAG: hypothetical protein WC716_12170 [Chitinophagaceae bacterium]|jgi:hypothetical protein
MFDILYEDFFEDPLAPDRVEMPARYFKVYSINGLPKKKEEYKDGHIVMVVYYIAPDEILEEVLALFPEKMDIRVRNCIGEYMHTRSREFVKGELLFPESTWVKDRNGNEIYFSSGDGETIKSYFDESGKELYVFWYRDNELVNMETCNPKHNGFNHEDQSFFSLEKMKALAGFDWAAMGYFHHAEPVIPDSV